MLNIGLNKNMKEDDLYNITSEVIEETWSGLAMSRPPIKGGRTAPQETKYRGIKIGAPEINMGLQSQASGQNPYEQEEEVNGVVDKRDLFNFIERLEMDLDNSKITDRTALMVLGKLKQAFK